MSKIQLVAQANLPTEYGIFKMVGFEFPDTKKEHVALVMGDISNQNEPVLARIHSECLTGDALHSLKCDCGFQLAAALRQISEAGRGVLIYHREEGRGIGLINKIRALKLLGWDKAPIYQCGCGNQACLDTYISGRGFEMLYRDLKGEELSAKEIIDRFYAKEESAVDFVRIFVELAAISIGNIITAFDPHMIVLGGGLSNFDYLYEALPKALPAHLMRSAKVPPIKKAKHGDSGGVRGAAALFLNCE